MEFQADVIKSRKDYLKGKYAKKSGESSNTPTRTFLSPNRDRKRSVVRVVRNNSAAPIEDNLGNGLEN
jgi:hypothetical protein